MATRRSKSDRGGSVLSSAQAYIEKRRFGGTGVDQSDSDEDQPRDPRLMDMSPNTQRRVKDSKEASTIKKLGPFETYMSLMKGFVCTSIIYLPKGVVNGGWGFTNLCFLTSMVITMFCALRLLETREKMNAASYTDIGTKLFGSKGKLGVNLAVGFSQFGFCCSYVFFICDNIFEMIKSISGNTKEVNINWFFLACFLVFSFLAFVRKIQKFAITH